MKKGQIGEENLFAPRLEIAVGGKATFKSKANKRRSTLDLVKETKEKWGFEMNNYSKKLQRHLMDLQDEKEYKEQEFRLPVPVGRHGEIVKGQKDGEEEVKLDEAELRLRHEIEQQAVSDVISKPSDDPDESCGVEES